MLKDTAPETLAPHDKSDGLKLRAYRNVLDLTQPDLAKQSGVDEGKIRRFELGESQFSEEELDQIRATFESEAFRLHGWSRLRGLDLALINAALEERLTDELATRAMGWKLTADAFITQEESIPRYYFQPTRKVEDAFYLINSVDSVCTSYRIASRPGACTVQVDAPSGSKTVNGEGGLTLSISIAVAEAVGIPMDTYVFGPDPFRSLTMDGPYGLRDTSYILFIYKEAGEIVIQHYC